MMARSELIQFVEQLASTHDLYQQTDLGGQHDADWADWYADEILNETASRLGLALDRAALSEWLEGEFAEFALKNGAWAEYLADRLLCISGNTEHGSE